MLKNSILRIDRRIYIPIITLSGSRNNPQANKTSSIVWNVWKKVSYDADYFEDSISWPIIRFLLAGWRKKGSVPVISTNFLAGVGPDGLRSLSSAGRNVAGHRSTEISLFRIGISLWAPSLIAVHLRPATVPKLLKRSTASEDSSLYSVKHAIYTAEAFLFSFSCIEEIVCDSVWIFSESLHTKWLLELPGCYRCDPRPLHPRPGTFDRFEESHQRNRSFEIYELHGRSFVITLTKHDPEMLFV